MSRKIILLYLRFENLLLNLVENINSLREEIWVKGYVVEKGMKVLFLVVD